jgi:hypothetical protein
MVMQLPLTLGTEVTVLRKALEALLAGPAAAAADPTLRASGSQAHIARVLMERLDRLVDREIEGS